MGPRDGKAGIIRQIYMLIPWNGSVLPSDDILCTAFFIRDFSPFRCTSSRLGA